jgi:hypothetical protein
VPASILEIIVDPEKKMFPEGSVQSAVGVAPEVDVGGLDTVVIVPVTAFIRSMEGRKTFAGGVTARKIRSPFGASVKAELREPPVLKVVTVPDAMAILRTCPSPASQRVDPAGSTAMLMPLPEAATNNAAEKLVSMLYGTTEDIIPVAVDTFWMRGTPEPDKM